MKRWMALLLAGLLVFPQAMVLRAEEAEDLIDGYAEIDADRHEEGILDNAIEEINSASDISKFTDVESEDLISVESPEECTEELCDEPKEVSANSSTPFITGFYNSTRGGDIRWSKVDGAAGYVLYRMRSADGLKKVATINNPDTLQYIDEGIKDNCWGLVYAYYVRPIINGKEGEKSDSVTLQRLAPMKITNVTQTSGTSVSLNWACSVNENKSYGYEVQYAEKNTDLYDRVGTFKAIPVEGRSNLSAAIGSLKSGKKYWIRVRCYVNYTHSVTGTLTKTWSQYSNIVTIKLASVSDTTPAYQVTDSVTNYRSGIWIYWTPTNARGYNVYRKTGADGQWQKIAYVAGQKAYRYHDAAVKDNNGVLYYYTVRGVIGSKLSDYDKNGRGILRLVPPDFTKTENSSTGTVSLAWNKNNAATGYVIRYSKDQEMSEGNTSTVTISANTTLTTEIKGLDVGATYYFNVRAYTVQGGDTYYGQWSSLSSVTLGRTESSTNVKVGDTIFFGAYEQDNIKSNGKEKIEWIVLAKNGSRVFITSKYQLDCKKYFAPYYGKITWEECTLRTWLNNDFLNAAFNTEEKNKIVTTNVVNSNNPEYGTPGGNNTKDKIFLLSIDEAKKYFSSDDGRKCEATAYARANGADQGSWWLRSPGKLGMTVMTIDKNGSFTKHAATAVNFSHAGVRPALWVTL